MSVVHISGKAVHPVHIECLACGASRLVVDIAETGECPCCQYVGWTYSDELDGSTRSMIMNGRLAVPHRPRRVSYRT